MTHLRKALVPQEIACIQSQKVEMGHLNLFKPKEPYPLTKAGFH